MTKDKNEETKQSIMEIGRILGQNALAGNDVSNVIRLEPQRVEEAIVSLENLRQRLGELEINKTRLATDSGYVRENLQTYDETLTVIITQLKAMIGFTIELLQKANDTFIDTDKKIAAKIKIR